MPARVEYKGYYVERDGEYLTFGALHSSSRVVLAEVELTEDGIALSEKFRKYHELREIIQNEWVNLLDEIQLEQPSQAPMQMRNHHVPDFIDSRSKMIEYLRLIARGVLVPAGVGKITQAAIHNALRKKGLL